MKRFALCAALAASPLLAFAQSANTITFQGEVSDQTCAVTVNGNASSPVVLLPTVANAAFATSGATAGLTSFTVGLSNCTVNAAAARNVDVKFVGGNLTSTGNLRNTGTATNVSLQLLDPATPAAPFNLSGGFAAPGLVIASGADAATHDFAVRYYAEATPVSPGTVIGAVQYAVAYR